MSTDKKLYLDEIEKIAYYKQKIIDSYIDRGTLIDKNKLQSKLDQIDTKLSIFRDRYISNGENMDIEKFNEQKHDIYLDLCILYRVAYKIAEERLASLQHHIDCELQAINEKAKEYGNRNQLETLSIYGNSIYFATNGFKQEYKDGQVIIDLGQIKIPSGSYLACICNCDETDSENVMFVFDDNLQAADYNYSKRYIKVLGNYDIRTKTIHKSEESLTAFSIETVNINPNSIYNVYAGENKIKIYQNDSHITKYIDITKNISLVTDTDCDISFYVYGASFIQFNHNSKAVYKSFDGYEITSPKYRQKILISAKAGFVLDIATDGVIYADKQKCTISENMLVCPTGYENVYDFMVEEIAYGADVVFDDVKVVAKNATTTFFDINYIAIKQAQISELDGEIE